MKLRKLDFSPELATLAQNLPVTLLLVDSECRILFAGGQQLASDGFDANTLVGQSLSELLTPESAQLFADAYRAAFEGSSTELDYDSPLGGGRYRVQISPYTDKRGRITAALSVTTDQSRLRNQQFEINQIRQLITFGSGTYERRSGWTSDPEVLEIWGLQTLGDTDVILNSIVIPSDRAKAAALWHELRATGGRGSLDYSIRKGGKGELRNLHGTWDVSLAEDGSVARVQTTQIDVTEIIASRNQLAAAQLEATQTREQLLRRVGAVLAHTSISLEESLHATHELAITAFGDGCGIRLFSPDGVHVTRTLLGQIDGTLIDNMDNWTRSDFSTVAELPETFQEAIRTQSPTRGVSRLGHFDADSTLDGIQFLAVPLRDSSKVFGLLTVARAANKKDFDDFEIDLAQLLADRLGAFVHADSVRAHNEELNNLHSHLGVRLQESEASRQALVVQLDETESRERLNLSEVLHDEPLQLVVAAMLRLDTWKGQADLDSDPTLDQIGTMLETSVEQLRMVISTLTPPDLSEGLGPAVRRLADATFFGSTTNVVVTGPNHVSLDPNTKVSVYRVVREALINARKHAQAANVLVELVNTHEMVQVRVTDDGIGIGELKSGSGHMGLTSMRARAEAAQAELVISSEPNSGTVVELSLAAHNPNTPNAVIRRVQGMARKAWRERA